MRSRSKKLTLTLLVVLAGAAGVYAVCQPGPRGDPASWGYREFVLAINAARDSDEEVSILVRGEERADALQQTGGAGHSLLRRVIASRYQGYEMYPDAIRCLDAVEHAPETNLDLLESFRMRALVLRDMGRLEEAVAALRLQRTVALQDPVNRTFNSQSLSAGANQLGTLLASLGRHAEAAESQSILFDGSIPTDGEPADSMQRRFAYAGLIRQAASYDREGRHPDAIAVMERVCAEFPTRDAEDGTPSHNRLYLGELQLRGGRALDAIATLTPLWNDPGLVNSPKTLTIGSHLARACHTVGRGGEAVTIQREALSRLESSMDRWARSDELAGHDAAAWQQSLLAGLDNAEMHGRPDIALEVAARRLADPTLTPTDRSHYQRRSEALLEAISRGGR